MDELKNKIRDILFDLYEGYGQREPLDNYVDQIISLFHGGKNYPNDYLNRWRDTKFPRGGAK